MNIVSLFLFSYSIVPYLLVFEISENKKLITIKGIIFVINKCNEDLIKKIYQSDDAHKNGKVVIIGEYTFILTMNRCFNPKNNISFGTRIAIFSNSLSNANKYEKEIIVR